MYAIVRTGGKQYRAEEGRSLKVDRLPGEEGSTVELSDVLLIGNDGDVTVGTPSIEGARVLTTIEEQGREKKLIVFKYKAKVRTRKKTGHRQGFTRLSVAEILAPGQERKTAEKARRARKPAGGEATAAPAPAEPDGEAPEPAAEVKPKRRVIRRPKTDEPRAEKDAAAEKPKRRPRKKDENKE